MSPKPRPRLLPRAAARPRADPARPDRTPEDDARWRLICLLLLAMVAGAVYMLPTVADSFAYLAGLGHTTTFIPRAHQLNCSSHGCSTSTTGVLANGGTRTPATWPGSAPLRHPFPVHEPPWNWASGRRLIGSYVSALMLFFFSLLVSLMGLLCLLILGLSTLAELLPPVQGTEDWPWPLAFPDRDQRGYRHPLVAAAGDGDDRGLPAPSPGSSLRGPRPLH